MRHPFSRIATSDIDQMLDNHCLVVTRPKNLVASPAFSKTPQTNQRRYYGSFCICDRLRCDLKTAGTTRCANQKSPKINNLSLTVVQKFMKHA
jgi:hypothetical protein